MVIMKLEFELSELIYSVVVPIDEFARLLNREESSLEDSTLCTDLEKIIGVREANYDGHFGNAVYVRIEADHDNAELKQQISKIIRKHLARK